MGAAAGENIFLAPPRTELDLLGELDSIVRWLQKCDPDAVIHLAGARPPASSGEMFASNAGATFNLLRAMDSASPAARLVVASSAAVYGQIAFGDVARTEAVPNPTNAYGASKWAEEEIAARACRMLGRRFTIARIFNVVGGPSDDYGVLPSLISRIGSANEGDVVPISDADCVRDFINVEDCASLMLAACKAEKAPEFVNVCTGIPVTIAGLADAISSALSRKVRFAFEPCDNPSVIRYSVGDQSGARLLGWKPKVSLSDSIRRMVERIVPDRSARQVMR